jgi:gliding motility-associated-like protein
MIIIFMKYLLQILFICLAGTLSLFSQDNPPNITISSSQTYCLGSETNIVTDITISNENQDDDTLDEVNVQISEGYQAGFDLLTYNGTNPDISANWNVNEGKLTLIGPATFSAFETAVLNVSFSTTQTFFTEDRSLSVNLGSANFLPLTGHYYFYVPSLSITWSQAKVAAENQTYFGLQGYLATLTFPGEAQISGEQSPGTGWIGASDEQEEGTWRWVTGPEQGDIFWIGTANGFAPNGAFEFWNNNEPNQSGNEDYAHITDPSIGISGSWNDLPNEGAASGPYQPQGYVVEFGGMPGDPEVNLSASTVMVMPQTRVEDRQTCEGSTTNLSVDSNADTINWYASEETDTILNTGLTYESSFGETTTLWIQPVYDDCSAQPDRIPLLITIAQNPVVNNITITECSSTNALSVADFTLDNYVDLFIENNASSNLSVTYFEDENLTIPINNGVYTNTENFENVYAQVSNTVLSSCSSIAELTLEVIFNDLGEVEISNCDDEVTDGITTFNLSEADDLMQTADDDNLVVSYYETQEDAVAQTNPLPDNYRNNEVNQVLYTRINDQNGCIGIGTLFLNVNELPTTENSTRYYCIDRSPDPIFITSGIEDNLIGNFTYLWSDGSNTSQIEINETGTYTVLITNENGCQIERSIDVLESEKPSIDNVIVKDFSVDNSIVVEASGIGSDNYQYSLDGEVYQDSNQFSNLTDNEYTIRVRDKNGCGEVLRLVYLLDYPRFFSPNGDGFNDRWQVINSDTEVFTKILIFDRYGKLIKDLDPTSPGWDGSYNGNPLPSADYWFKVEREDGRIFSGNFTLKR